MRNCIGTSSTSRSWSTKYRLFVHPIVPGRGTPGFADVGRRLRVGLVSSQTFDSAVVGLRHASADAPETTDA
jgi:hypothetical protein